MKNFTDIAREVIDEVYLANEDGLVSNNPDKGYVTVESAVRTLRRNFQSVIESIGRCSLPATTKYTEAEAMVVKKILTDISTESGIFSAVKASHPDITTPIRHKFIQEIVDFLDDSGIEEEKIVDELPHLDEVFELTLTALIGTCHSSIECLIFNTQRMPYAERVRVFQEIQDRIIDIFMSGFESAIQSNVKRFDEVVKQKGEENITIEDVTKVLLSAGVVCLKDDEPYS